MSVIKMNDPRDKQIKILEGYLREYSRSSTNTLLALMFLVWIVALFAPWVFTEMSFLEVTVLLGYATLWAALPWVIGDTPDMIGGMVYTIATIPAYIVIQMMVNTVHNERLM